MRDQDRGKEVVGASTSAVATLSMPEVAVEVDAPQKTSKRATPSLYSSSYDVILFFAALLLQFVPYLLVLSLSVQLHHWA